MPVSPRYMNGYGSHMYGWLFNNIADAMEGVPEPIVERQFGLFERVDPAYAAGVRSALSAKGKQPVLPMR